LRFGQTFPTTRQLSCDFSKTDTMLCSMRVTIGKVEGRGSMKYQLVIMVQGSLWCPPNLHTSRYNTLQGFAKHSDACMRSTNPLTYLHFL
jgi:hypothetical protein